MATETTLSMKLLIHRKAQRVLMAEASKDVVDFLFSLLVLPVATVVKLIGKDDMAGCVGDLYASVEKLDSTYVQPGASKDALLCAAVSSPAAQTANCSLLRLPSQLSSSSQPKAFYKCSYRYDSGCYNYVTDVCVTSCPSCSRQMTSFLKYVSPASGVSGQQLQNAPTGEANGFVQSNATYTVMDNLAILPMSSLSCITTLLSNFAVRDIGDLQEKTVQLGYKEGLAILKASMQSKTVLTDVFLGKKQAHPVRVW